MGCAGADAGPWPVDHRLVAYPAAMPLTEDFIRQNEWATLTLVEACRELTDEHLDDSSTTGVYGSIRATFHHIVSAEGGYATLLGHEPEGRLRSRDPWPGFDGLADQVRKAADSLVAATFEDHDRRIPLGDGWEVEASVVLIQAVHHGTDHRSQICTILTDLGVEPPEIDSWSWSEADGRAQEIDEERPSEG